MLMTMAARNAEFSLLYPAIESEFEVQAWLYGNLRDLGFDVRGEVQALGCFGMRKTKAGCRFDLVLYDAMKKPICIFEVKARPVKHKISVDETRQGMRYPLFGVPVHFVYGMAGARAALALFAK